MSSFDSLIQFIKQNFVVPDGMRIEQSPEQEGCLYQTLLNLRKYRHDQEKRAKIQKDLGRLCLAKVFHGFVYLLILGLSVYFAAWALDYDEKYRIKFYPPDETIALLSHEHEKLEACASLLITKAGQRNDIPFNTFDSKFIETIKPIKIFSDEYAVYFMTSKDWYNGEHGILIVKDVDNMPPNVDWGLIEGKVFTYAIYE